MSSNVTYFSVVLIGYFITGLLLSDQPVAAHELACNETNFTEVCGNASLCINGTCANITLITSTSEATTSLTSTETITSTTVLTTEFPTTQRTPDDCEPLHDNFTSVTGFYRCLHLSSISANWSAALAACHKHNASLMHMRDAALLALANKLLREASVHAAWIGGREIEMNWTWPTGALLGAYQPWQFGEADNRMENEKCAIVLPWKEFKWDDRMCGGRKYSICESAGVPPTWCAARGAGSFHVSGRCFFPQYLELSWREAEIECRIQDGHLAVVDAPEVTLAMQQSDLNKENTYWIGLHKDGWVWHNSARMRENYWAAEQPVRGYAHCVRHEEYGDTYGWGNWFCDANLPFFCESFKSLPGYTTIQGTTVEATATSSAPITSSAQVVATASDNITEIPATSATARSTTVDNMTLVGIMIGGGFGLLLVVAVLFGVFALLSKYRTGWTRRRRKNSFGSFSSSFSVERRAKQAPKQTSPWNQYTGTPSRRALAHKNAISGRHHNASELLFYHIGPDHARWSWAARDGPNSGQSQTALGTRPTRSAPTKNPKDMVNRMSGFSEMDYSLFKQ